MENIENSKEEAAEIIITPGGGKSITASPWDGKSSLADIIENMLKYSKLAPETKLYINSYIGEAVKNNMVKCEKSCFRQKYKDIWTIKDAEFEDFEVSVTYSEVFNSYFVIMPHN